MRIVLRGNILLACLSALLFLPTAQGAHSQGKAQVIQLTNDSSFTLLGWSYGKYHELAPGHESRHANISPSDKPDPNEIASCETEEAALVLWIKRAGPAARLDHGGVHMAWMRQHLRVVDENGHEFAPTIAHWRMNRSPNPKALTDEPIALASFPRRGQTIIVRIYSLDATQVLGEFRIPNPVRDLPPPFAVERFPFTGKSGDLEVTLTSVVKGNPLLFLQNDGNGQLSEDRAQPPLGYHAAPEEARRLAAHFTVAFQGKPTSHWMLTGLDATMWDASGNQMEPESPAAGDERISYLAPNTGEPFRLRIHAIQKADANFVPDRVWSVSRVTVPTAGIILRIEKGIEIDGIDLQLLGIVGAGVQEIDHVPLSPPPPGYVAVVLQATYVGPRPQFVLRVSDAQEHPILPTDPNANLGFPRAQAKSPWFSAGGSLGANAGNFVYWVKVPPGNRKIDLTFGLNRARPFEFVLPVSTP
jgi:hypothetical protein